MRRGLGSRRRQGKRRQQDSAHPNLSNTNSPSIASDRPANTTVSDEVSTSFGMCRHDGRTETDVSVVDVVKKFHVDAGGIRLPVEEVCLCRLQALGTSSHKYCCERLHWS